MSENNQVFSKVFKLEKVTKGALRYAEQPAGNGMPPSVGTIYVKKWAFADSEGNAPETLTVSVTPSSDVVSMEQFQATE